MRGIVIAGTHSGCGKTTVTLGILAALRKRGLVVQPFKAGPDFIDAGLHGIVTGRTSRNLDQWMCGPDYVTACFARNAAEADIAVVEGVMGMYDGDLSTARLAHLLHVPVILVVDGYGMAESAGAVVHGFAGFGSRDDKPELAGVIFNRVASENHFNRLKASVRDVPVLGYLPRELDFEIPHRHLGLTIAEEGPLAGTNIDRLADTILRHIDIDALVRHAGAGVRHAERAGAPGGEQASSGARRFKLAVAYDRAFSFYYEDNFDLLSDAGVEIIRFSPIADAAIPDGADAVYIGGGYPELHADRLSRNTSMLGSVRAWSDSGKPLYAECGGLMYLSKGIRDFDQTLFAMAGVFSFETQMMKKPRLGYREIALSADCILGRRGDRCRGHEFHYSEIRDETRGDLYTVSDNRGKVLPAEGFRTKNTLASYIHVHFGSNVHIAQQVAAFIKGDRTA
jgi:cobyrinic acid a,c-diamide synthase